MHRKKFPPQSISRIPAGSNQVVHRQMRGAKSGDDQNAADIIDHSESGQKDFQAQRGTRLPNRLSTPSQKGDIRSHRYGRPLWAGVPAVAK